MAFRDNLDPRKLGRQAVDLGVIDLEKYDFDGLRSDITSILDVQSAIKTTLKWSLLIPVIGSVIAWFVFDGRMPRWTLVPYMIVLIGLLVLVAVNVGLMFVLRNRIAETNQAADRVLAMTSDLHTDYLQVRSGENELPLKEMAGLLTRELVFPVLISGGSSAFSTAATASGPMGWLAQRALAVPLRRVEARVLDVLGSSELDQAAKEIEPGFDDRIEGSEIVAAALTPTLGSAGDHELVEDWYAKAHEAVHRVVDGMSTVATGSLSTVLFLAALPLVGWLALGWFLL